MLAQGNAVEVKRSRRRGWQCWATAPTASGSTRWSRRCARPV